jgi:site-specific recombinase XerD
LTQPNQWFEKEIGKQMKLSQQVTTVSLESIEEFRNWLCDHGKSLHTAKAYSTDMRMFLLATQTEEHTMILPDEFEELAVGWLTLTRRQVQPKTTTRRLTSLRAFSKWAGWGDVLSDYDAPVPAKSVPHPLPEGMEGVRKLVVLAPTERQRALIALCGMCGCRIGEALSIYPSNFNTSEMMLTIRGKGDKTRVVPISKEAWSILEIPIIHAFANGTTVVNLRDRHARKTITTLGKRAGLRRRISSHDLRATFATEVYNKTLDIRLVQELLGHSNSSITEIYIGINRDKMRAAVEL